jgi:hypothetical protein
VAGGAGPSQTQQIDELLTVGRGQSVGPVLATSSDGGGIAADLLAARPVQVIVCLRPCILPVPSGNCPDTLLLSPFGPLGAGYESTTVSTGARMQPKCLRCLSTHAANDREKRYKQYLVHPATWMRRAVLNF